MVGFYFEDLSVPDSELVKHPDIQSQHPHVKNPDSDTPPCGKVSREIGLIGNGEIVDLNDDE